MHFQRSRLLLLKKFAKSRSGYLLLPIGFGAESRGCLRREAIGSAPFGARIVAFCRIAAGCDLGFCKNRCNDAGIELCIPSLQVAKRDLDQTIDTIKTAWMTTNYS